MSSYVYMRTPIDLPDPLLRKLIRRRWAEAIHRAFAQRVMLEALRAYREAGYDGMILPDHVPRIEGDQGSRQAFAFAWGYIKSLMDLVNNEA